MDGKIVFRIMAALVLLAAIAGVAFFAFNAGVATHVQVPATGNGQVPYPYYGYGFAHPFPFFGFGCFAPLIGLFLVFLALTRLQLPVLGTALGTLGSHASRLAPRLGRGRRSAADVPGMA